MIRFKLNYDLKVKENVIFFKYILFIETSLKHYFEHKVTQK